MKASELIAELQAMIKQHGDLKVRTISYDDRFEEWMYPHLKIERESPRKKPYIYIQ